MASQKSNNSSAIPSVNSEGGSSISHEPPSALLAALRRLLRPLVKLLLHYQITYPVLSDLLKSVYVHVANEDFSLPGKNQTDSRISLLTGVHRKDIKRRLHQDGDEDASQSPLMAQLVATWLSDPAYCDKNGKAMPLARLRTQKDKSSFEALVESVNKKDLRARVVLDDCLHQQMVHIDDNDRVHLNLEAFVPEHGFDDKAVFFGNSLRDHLSAAEHNLRNHSQQAGHRYFDRGVYYNHLTPESVDQLSQLVNAQGMDLLKTVNRRAKQLQKADHKKENARQRINLGMFFFHEHLLDEHDPENEHE